MFGAFFGSIMGKVSAGLLLVAVVALGWLYVEHLQDAKDKSDKDAKIAQQATKIDTLQGTNDNLTKQLVTQKGLLDAADKTRHDAAVSTDNLVKKDQTVSQQTHEKVIKIEAAYASMPQTADNISKRDAEISRTRVAGLSAVFCNSNPNDPSCTGGGAASAPTVAASAASH